MGPMSGLCPGPTGQPGPVNRAGRQVEPLVRDAQPGPEPVRKAVCFCTASDWMFQIFRPGPDSKCLDPTQCLDLESTCVMYFDVF